MEDVMAGPDLMDASIPAANGFFTARALATMYAMLAGGGAVGGIRLLSEETVRQVGMQQSNERDLVLVMPTPPPDLSVTIDPTGTATKEGGAWISGTVTCTGGGPNAQVFGVDGQVTQTVGRLIISSFFFAETRVPCDGRPYPWKAYAPPTNGKFAGGKAVTVSSAWVSHGKLETSKGGRSTSGR